MSLPFIASRTASGFLLFSLIFPWGCTNDADVPGTTTSSLERAEWDFGAVSYEGAAGAGGGAATPDFITLSDFEDAVESFTRFVSACGTFRAGSFSFGHFRSSPYRTHLLSCIAKTAVCATQREYLCADYPQEWQECFQEFETFTCDNGELINGPYQCDTYIDCDDGEDERNCQELWYQCADGTPVLQSDRCDDSVDCPDASDEQDCEIDYFVCDNYRGIPTWEVCDGTKDCADGSDEDDGCAQVTCQ